MSFWENSLATRAHSIRASEIRELLRICRRENVLSFAGGIPDPSLLPTSAIAELTAEIGLDPAVGRQALQYAPSEGEVELRSWLVHYMGRQGICCGLDNILITSGSQQALDLLAKLLIEEGGIVGVEQPTYLGALQAFAGYRPVYVDIETDLARDLVYCVPDFANPSGRTMSLEKRVRLIDDAHSKSQAIVEDAAYRDLRFEGENLPSVLALDVAKAGGIDGTRTAYCGTFSKTLSPGLRVGWVCAAKELIAKLVIAKQAADLHSPTLNQLLVARLASRQFDERVTTNVASYRRRRDAMADALCRHLPASFSWQPPNGGMFFWLTGPKEMDFEASLPGAIQEAGVAYVPGKAFLTDGTGRNCLRLSFSMLDEAQIEVGVGRLGRYFEQSRKLVRAA